MFQNFHNSLNSLE